MPNSPIWKVIIYHNKAQGISVEIRVREDGEHTAYDKLREKIAAEPGFKPI